MDSPEKSAGSEVASWDARQCSAVTGRLAPSPTGALHLGNIRTFMVAWLSVRSRDGRLILRIEDLDHPKVKPQAAQETIDDLRWLGFDWDEGPDIGGAHGPYVQSMRGAFYTSALEQLREASAIYPCACTRADVERCQSAPHEGEILRYPGTCRGRFADYAEALSASTGRQPAWRFKVEDGAETGFRDTFADWYSQIPSHCTGDFIVARGLFRAAYALAVVVDDAAMGVSEVVRGDDLLEATPAQILLQRALGLPEPRYCHVPLVVGPDGRRLAKRHGDSRISTFRASGARPEQIIGALAETCGWAERGEEISLRDLLPRFDLKKIPRSPAVVENPEKWLRG